MYLVEGIDLSKTFSVKFNYGNPLDLNINTPIEYSNIIHNAYIDAYCAGINYDNLLIQKTILIFHFTISLKI